MVKNKFFFCNILILILLIIIPLFITPTKNNEINTFNKNIFPNKTFLFGTDDLGRDLFIRTFIGIRTSLAIGSICCILNSLLGILIGSIAAFFNKLDEFLMRLCDVLTSIPPLIFSILICIAFINNNIFITILSLTLTGWIHSARIIRAQLLQIKEMNFILSAKALGASNFRIITKHLLPNIRASLICIITFNMCYSLLTEVVLNLIGVGIQPPNISLGSLINNSISSFIYYPFQLIFPSIFLCLIILTINFISDKIQAIYIIRK